MELIDGVLHREDVSDSSRWCVVVPCELRNDLLKEDHSCVFAYHFSEHKCMIASVGLTGGMA